MPFRLYLMGHGTYAPSDGFFPLRRGFTAHFYTEHAKTLPTALLKPILWGNMQPVRTISEFRDCPNLTWHNGKPENWDKFVTQSDPLHTGPNKNLPLSQRHLTWDVCYVEFFKAGATDTAPTNQQLQQKFTLSDLLLAPHEYFSDKTAPIEIHVLLCSFVKLERTALGIEAGVNAGEFRQYYSHRPFEPGGTRAKSRVVVGETAQNFHRNVNPGSQLARGESQLPLSMFAQDLGLFPEPRPDWAKLQNCGVCNYRYQPSDKFCRECGAERPS